MINTLYLGIFSFLEFLIKPLWGIVILVFLAILVVLSATIIKEAKKRQRGIKPQISRTDYFREIEPYSEMPYVRITFNGREPEYLNTIQNNEIVCSEDVINKDVFETKDIEEPAKEKRKSLRKMKQ